MTKKKLFTGLLLLWVMAVVGYFISQQVSLSGRLNDDGPLALAADGHGGFFLATRQELFHFNADEKLEWRRRATTLGMQELNALALADDGTLWIYDSEQQRPFHCSADWQCQARGPADGDLDINVEMATNGQELWLADNSHHRLLRLTESGELLPVEGVRYSYPNQISRHGEGWLIANTNRRSILALDAKGTQAQTALKTEERPYRFVNEGQDWWVLESGIALTEAELRHYRVDGDKVTADTITLSASDPVSMIRHGDNLLITSHDDWRLLNLSPTTGIEQPVADAAIQAEFTRYREERNDVRAQSQRLPWIMAGLLLPALIAGWLMQRREPAGKTAWNPLLSSSNTPTQTTTASVPAPKPHQVLPDHEALQMARLQLRTLFIRLGLALFAILGVVGLLMALTLPKADSSLLLIILGVPALLVGALFFMLRQQLDRLLQQRLVFGPSRAMLLQGDKLLKQAPHAKVALGPGVLLLGRHIVRLRGGMGGQTPVWLRFDLIREMQAHGSSENIADNPRDFWRILWRLRHPYLVVLIAQYALLPLMLVGILIGKLLKYDWLWQWFF